MSNLILAAARGDRASPGVIDFKTARSRLHLHRHRYSGLDRSPDVWLERLAARCSVSLE
jgi:hypothetical protein